MPRKSRPSKLLRPFRRMRRWARHTPNGVIAMNLAVSGLVLLFVAGILALTIV